MLIKEIKEKAKNNQKIDKQYQKFANGEIGWDELVSRTLNIMAEEEKEEPEIRIPENVVDPDEETDFDLFENPVLCPRTLYNEHKHNFSAKCMYSALNALLMHRDSAGVVQGVTTMEMAKHYGYTDSRRIRDGINRLETEGIIEVDRSALVNTYKFVDNDLSKGCFVIPQEFIKQISDYTLKDMRLIWYYLSLNHHSPRNNRKFPINLETLKSVVNADSFVEVERLAHGIKDSLFNKIATIKSGISRGKDKLKVVFDNLKVGVIEISKKQIEKLKRHPHYKDIKHMFRNLRISHSWRKISSALEIIERYSQEVINTVRKVVMESNFRSKVNSASYLEKLFELVASGRLR
ncbi:hypothetical protein [Fuchsiella alkaliacetigena]|uniref:hypothetical protein n=1 Tax=Fuchsiella alkaliacetigena TaxID=957042 RepID=UPI00200AC330|nr:hypothetical protein [Fuchsiella alkaliacetigena]MCK8825500.1 hypothetical protein [Fuchsiella alkaliacetigena]